MSLYSEALKAGMDAYSKWAQTAQNWDPGRDSGINVDELSNRPGTTINSYADALTKAFQSATNAVGSLSPQMRDFQLDDTRKRYMTQFLSDVSGGGKLDAEAFAKSIPSFFAGGRSVGGTPSSGTSFQDYTVKWGDTLAALAQRFGTTVQQLASANNITDPNRIISGTRLRVPGAGGTSPASVSWGADPTKVGLDASEIDRVYEKFLAAFSGNAATDKIAATLQGLSAQELAGILGLQVNAQNAAPVANLKNRSLDDVIGGMSSSAVFSAPAWQKILEMYR